MNIDYKEITEYYKNIISEISTVIYNTKKKYEKNSNELEEIESDYLSWYSSSDKAYYRIIDVLDLDDYYDEPDFQYWALEKFSDARHRISSYIERSSDLLDFNGIDYKKYDDIVIDYYKPIRLTDDEKLQETKEKGWDKYQSISHLRVIVNLGLIDDIKDIKRYINETEYLSEDVKMENNNVLDEMLCLSKKLLGYKEGFRYP